MGGSRPRRSLLCILFLLPVLGALGGCQDSSQAEDVDAQPACTDLCTAAQFPDAFAETSGAVITCFCRGEGTASAGGQAPAITQEACSEMCSGFEKPSASAFSSTSTAKNTCRCS